MTELKVTKEELFVALRALIECYEAYKEMAKDNPRFVATVGTPIDTTLARYDDFYEWLQLGRNL